MRRGATATASRKRQRAHLDELAAPEARSCSTQRGPRPACGRARACCWRRRRVPPRARRSRRRPRPVSYTHLTLPTIC
eukprot:12413967-Alexandrium_andersonii.AAC.1